MGAGDKRREIIQGCRHAFGHAAVRKRAAMHGMQRGNGEKQAQTNHESKSAVGRVQALKNAGNARYSTSKNLNLRKRQ